MHSLHRQGRSGQREEWVCEICNLRGLSQEEGDVMSNYLLQAGLVASQFALAFIFGWIFYWLFRKLRARFQCRIGPPIIQPLADIVKLFSKKTIMPSAASRPWFTIAPLLALAGYLTALALTPLGVAAPLSVTGDVLVVLIALAIPGVSIIIAGSSSGNPYGAIGSSRELTLLVASEIPFVVSAIALVKAAGGLSMASIIAAQSGTPFLFSYPFAAVAFFIALVLKLGRKPFDIPDAEVEIVAGPLTDYSGSLLGLFELGNVFRWIVLPAIAVDLFFAGGRFTGIPLVDVACFLALCVVIVFIVSYVDSQSTRLRVDQAFKFLLAWGLALALIDLIRASTGWLVW
ncbi:MAG: NADH-quinone oxidoreductase subunit H [Thermoprotei archaeon]|nr:MAG: NADH-quinone oxidoreductase subunit H [Thermoprotei archaeon]